MKVKALDNFDNFQRGDEVDLPPKYAEGVIKKGLAVALEEDGKKADDAPANKMDADPANKQRGARSNAARNA